MGFQGDDYIMCLTSQHNFGIERTEKTLRFPRFSPGGAVEIGSQSTHVRDTQKN